jgi:hypothetical protein
MLFRYLSGINIAIAGSRVKQMEPPRTESMLAFTDELAADEPPKGVSDAVITRYFKLNYAD